MLGCIGRCLWIRRLSIIDPSYWENAFAAALVFQAFGAVLTCSQHADRLDRILYNLTGVSELEEWAGHMCYLGSVAALLCHALIRLESHRRVWIVYWRHVKPAMLTVPITLVLLCMSPKTDYELDHGLVNAETDYWLNCYWLVYCGTMTYLLMYGAKLFLQIRVDERSRCCANMFLVCIAFGVTACTVRMATLFNAHQWDIYAGSVMWFGTVVATTLMALAATKSWQNKVKYFTTHDAEKQAQQ